MDLSGDDLAGVVDIFGGLTRDELDEAIEELAFKRGEDHHSDVAGAAIEDALDSYHLVALDREEPLLVPGPAAFPALPDGATDLPHIMDVPERSVDRETVAAAAAKKLRADAEAAVDAGDAQEATRLVDLSYDLEAWGPVDAADVRERLEDV
jgi:hypothetical protein